MKITHSDSPQGYYAAYTLTEAPWASVEPLLYWSHVVRAEHAAEIVGMVVAETEVVPADELDGFATYWRPRSAETAEEEYKALFGALAQQGYERYLTANPHLRYQEQATTAALPTQSRRKRRAGSGEIPNE